jgi:hypothetical protein
MTGSRLTHEVLVSYVLFISDQFSNTARLFLRNKSNVHVTRLLIPSIGRFLWNLSFFFSSISVAQFLTRNKMSSYLSRETYLVNQHYICFRRSGVFLFKFRVTKILKVKAFVCQEKVAKCSERISSVKCSKRSDENCQDCVFLSVSHLALAVSHVKPFST